VLLVSSSIPSLRFTTLWSSGFSSPHVVTCNSMAPQEGESWKGLPVCLDDLFKRQGPQMLSVFVVTSLQTHFTIPIVLLTAQFRPISMVSFVTLFSKCHIMFTIFGWWMKNPLSVYSLISQFYMLIIALNFYMVFVIKCV
jgi:hypothetical protein